ncbi:hypothetical protein B0T19DRAFT_449970 [Cercophora scortea]|uniref:Uncharacterized protein n=1 Tax=Cercophora scortea TaxID=314031 RepID=A0AAE0IP94_9PEZI|nr:hypothetical protein B0T19DRAFT_449970 [Cercophora scortea]
MGELLARWAGLDLLTLLPPPTSPRTYPWGTAQAGPPVCPGGCTLHSDLDHDAAKLVRVYHTIPAEFLNNNTVPWITSPPPPPPQERPTVGSGTFWPGTSPAQGVENNELLRVYVRFIARFKASLDGNPDVSNAYLKYYVPYCVHSPLLANVAIYTAAGFLSQTGHIDGTVVMAHKGRAIGLLNEHLRSQASTSDEEVASIVQIIVNEWYWGDANDLRAHLRGLREMIKFRGGFRTLGLHGLISKLAITSDVAIALSFEIPPFLQGGTEFEYHEARTSQAPPPLRLALNTPLVSPLSPFASCAEALRIHPATASILDDMRFLIAAVLALPEQPSAKALQKVHSTSAWIYDRMSRLPAAAPAARRLSSASAAGSTSSTQGARSRGTRSFQQAGSPSLVENQDQQQQQQQQQRVDGRLAPADQQQSSSLAAELNPPDYVYQAVRLAALLYSRAIMVRQPFSAVVGTNDALRLWVTTWRVPLAVWRSLLGVFSWLLVPLVASPAADVPSHGLWIKGMLNASFLQIGVDNWEIAYGAMDSALRLQRWLGAGETQDSDSAGGEGGEGSRSQGGGGGGRSRSASGSGYSGGIVDRMDA